MSRLFAVTCTHDTRWAEGCPLEGQEDWTAHAAFMDALVADGLVILGGPLEGTPDVLLIMRARDPEEIRARLADDPWQRSGLLRLGRVDPWILRLGSLA